MMRSTALLMVGCFVIVAVTQAQDDAAQKELKHFQGHWQLLSLVRNGEKLPDEQTKGAQVTVQGNTYTVKVNGEVKEEGTFKLDPSRRPKWIDITPTKGEGKGQTYLGIYEVKGDTYTLCTASPGQPRPKTLTSEPGSNHFLQTARKMKSKD